MDILYNNAHEVDSNTKTHSVDMTFLDMTFLDSFHLVSMEQFSVIILPKENQVATQ